MGSPPRSTVSLVNSRVPSTMVFATCCPARMASAGEPVAVHDPMRLLSGRVPGAVPDEAGELPARVWVDDRAVEPPAGALVLRPRSLVAGIGCNRHTGADEMREHLTSGKQVTQLALTFEERMRFVLDETLTVRKFKLLDIAVEQLDKGDRDSAKAELDARFVLLAGEVARLLAAIETTFGVHRPQSL